MSDLPIQVKTIAPERQFNKVMAYTETDIWNALRQVEEPDLKQDLVTLGMVQELVLANGKVSFTVVLTTPACPLKEMIERACITAIHHLVDPALEVNIKMTARVTTQHTSSSGVMAGVKNLIAVASGKGGVGKSTIATNLAIALAQAGSKVGLLDADIYGPSQPMLMGLLDTRPEVSQEDGRQVMHPLVSYGIQVMSIGFLVEPGAALAWRGPMASNAFKQLASDTAWGELDYLIVDAPPGTGDIHITLAQQFPLMGVVLVTTPQEVALSDARKAAAMFRASAIDVPILGVVENMAYFSPPELPDKKYYLFGKGGGTKLALELDVPLLGQIPLIERIQEGGDAGRPAALAGEPVLTDAFQALAAAVAQQVSIRNASLGGVVQ